TAGRGCGSASTSKAMAFEALRRTPCPRRPTPPARRGGATASPQHYFCSRPDHSGQFRNGNEQILLRAVGDVLLEPRRAVAARVQAVERRGERVREELASCRRVRPFATKQ